MCLRDFIKTHYASACDLQRGILRDGEMKSMLMSGNSDDRLVMAWMKDYGLFQGIKNEVRKKAAAAFLAFATRHRDSANVTDRAVLAATYRELFAALFSTERRSWLSATSKLLWCIYPDQIVLYDSFVERTLIVMQGLDVELARFTRLGNPPSVKVKADISSAVAYYMNYQDMVRHLFAANVATLRQLRKQHNESYPHDIRIFDKLLWMIGNPNYRFQ